MWESVEDEVSEEEGEEVDGASVSIKKRYCTTDSDLKPAARLSAYDSNSWRIEVRSLVVKLVSLRKILQV